MQPPLADLRDLSGRELRALARSGAFHGPTPGVARGYVQANLVVLPRAQAFDFLLFCQRNPRPCPLLDVTEPGSFEPTGCAPAADLRTDVPRYLVYEEGTLGAELLDISHLWQKDWVSFLIGCSFTFENALLQADVPVRHIEEGCNVPMYRTSIPCRTAGIFHGPLVVSMRPMTPSQAIRAVQVCMRFDKAHGTPLHLGDPSALGIGDLSKPDFGDPVPIRSDELPVFWACGVTPQAIVLQSKPPLCITHKPGHMFITDWQEKDLNTHA